MTCKSLLGVKGLNRREVVCWSIVCTRKCFFIDNDSENNLVWRWCLLNNSWCFVTLLQQSNIFKIFHVINIFHVMLIFWLFLLFFSKFNDEHKMRKFLLVWIIVNKGKKIMLDLSKLQPASGNSFSFPTFLTIFLWSEALLCPHYSSQCSVCSCRFPLFTQFVSLIFKTLSEYKKRFAVYQDNLVRARKMQDMEQGSAKYGETVFSDLTGLSPQLWLFKGKLTLMLHMHVVCQPYKHMGNLFK